MLFKKLAKWVGGVVLGVGMAQASVADLKIGYVDIQRLMDEAPQAQVANRQFKQEFSQRQTALQNKEKDLKSLEDQMARDGAVMSDDERLQKERDLEARRRELERSQDDFREDLNLRRNEVIGKLMQVMRDTIKVIGKNQGYDLIMYDGVAYAGAGVDITNRVLDRLKTTATKPSSAGGSAAGRDGTAPSP